LGQFSFCNLILRDSIGNTHVVPRLIGAAIKRRSFVSAYSAAMSWHLGFSIGIGVYFIITLFFKVGEEDVNDCIANYGDNFIMLVACEKGFYIFRSIMIGLLIVFWLLQLCTSLFFLISESTGNLFLERCLLTDVQGVISSLPITSHN
jgi:hypothetical protein